MSKTPAGGDAVSDAPSIVVRGDGDDADAVAESVRDAGGVAVRLGAGAADASSEDSTTPDAVFAVGEDALFALTEFDPAAPVLPVGCQVGPGGVSPAAVADAVGSLRAGDVRTVSHPVLAVSVDGAATGQALTDATLVTDEPARISEYAVSTPAGRVETVRADGVVVATPLGSHGYARAAGGPVLAPETGLVTVPISPYSTRSNSWVLRPPVTISVERDEAAVSLVLDDETCRTVPVHAPVELAVDGSRPFLQVATDDA